MQFDCFLTHDWGEDEGGRNNHARVARVCANLKKEGLRPWFDEERMRGDINDKMADGIEGSGCVVCFITKRYIQKAGGKGLTITASTSSIMPSAERASRR